MVTHPSSNRARRRLTSLIETNALPLGQTTTSDRTPVSCSVATIILNTLNDDDDDEDDGGDESELSEELNDYQNCYVHTAQNSTVTPVVLTGASKPSFPVSSVVFVFLHLSFVASCN